MFACQHQACGALTHFGGVSRSFVHRLILSRKSASDQPGAVQAVTWRHNRGAPLRYCTSDRGERVKRLVILFLDYLKEGRLHLDPHQVEANEYPHRHLEFPIP